MATQTLLSAVTSDGAGSGVSHTGACTVILHGDSVMDGCSVGIEIADSDTAADYATVGPQGVFRQPGSVLVNGQGTYYLRAVVANSGTNTSVTCKTVQ